MEIKLATECCIRYEDKILLQERSLDSKNFPGYLSLPGGKIEDGEDPVTAAIREVFEETGIKILAKDIKLKLQAINHHIDKKQTWIIFAFVAELNEEPLLVPSDEGKLEWFLIEELNDNLKIFPPIKYYFDHVLNNKPGILFMSAELKNGEIQKVLSENIILTP